MKGKNSSRRVESSLKRASFLGHLGLIVGAYKELEVDKLIDEKLPKSSSQNNLCVFPIVYLDFRDQCRQPKSQSIISCLVYFVADTKELTVFSKMLENKGSWLL